MTGRRIVTGHVGMEHAPGPESRHSQQPAHPDVSILINDTVELPDISSVPGAKSASLWATSSTPAYNATHDRTKSAALEQLDDARLAGDRLVVPGGSNLRMTTLEPNAYVGMHRSSSIDYNIITQGSLYLITPAGSYDADTGKEVLQETLCQAGDTVVQRGTLHAWRAGDKGAAWVTVILEALPIVYDGAVLPDVAL